MENGYVKIFRKFLKWEWYQKPNMVHLFLYFLLKANHEDNQWQGQIIRRGQCVVGRKKASIDTGISEQSYRSCVFKLKSTNEITIKSTNKYSIITIVKYNDYQDIKIKSTNEKLSNQPANQPTTNHKQEEEEEKKNIIMPAGADIEDLMEEKRGIQYDYQYQGLEIYEKTRAPKDKKSECIRLAKKYPQHINPALSFCLDYPNPALKWKMFLWKLNSLIKQ